MSFFANVQPVRIPPRAYLKRKFSNIWKPTEILMQNIQKIFFNILFSVFQKFELLLLGL